MDSVLPELYPRFILLNVETSFLCFFKYDNNLLSNCTTCLVQLNLWAVGSRYAQPYSYVVLGNVFDTFLPLVCKLFLLTEAV